MTFVQRKGSRRKNLKWGSVARHHNNLKRKAQK